MTFTPFIKGLITSILMIAIFLLIYLWGDKANTSLQYLVYLVYGLGIYWAISVYRRSDQFTGKFGDLFLQGFKCFIVVTLAMALFYGIFNYLHPQFAEESAKLYREQLTSEKKLPSDIESETATYKKQYSLRLISGAIFGYLIIGAAVSALISAISFRRK